MTTAVLKSIPWAVVCRGINKPHVRNKGHLCEHATTLVLNADGTLTTCPTCHGVGFIANADDKADFCPMCNVSP